ncbi:MAG: hypothetical protein GXP05_05580 [Alphaproteobacteria bacterium]|nr:hypothetical protein [Alphaproteobacteria bacterium]
MALRFAYNGHGIFPDTTQLVATGIRKGRLNQVLATIRFRPFEFHAIFPANSPRDSLARLVVDFLPDQDWAQGDEFVRRQRATPNARKPALGNRRSGFQVQEIVRKSWFFEVPEPSAKEETSLQQRGGVCCAKQRRRAR